MAKWSKYEQKLPAVRHLFHVHTKFTDGSLTVREWFEVARSLGVDKITFLEHIRENPTYNVRQYLDEIEFCSAYFNIRGVKGLEAKLLPDGFLDVPAALLGDVEVLGLAEHSFPSDVKLFIDSWRRAVVRYKSEYPCLEIVWVHPGLWLKKQGKLFEMREIYEKMLHEAVALGISVEKNLRYNLVPDEFEYIVPREKLVIGVDAHRLSDLASLCSYFWLT